MYCSEEEFITDVRDVIEWEGHNSTPIYITKRENDEKSLQYSAIGAIQTEENNEELIRKLMISSLKRDFDFIGSEMDISRGAVVDYIFVKATISQKLF